MSGRLSRKRKSSTSVPENTVDSVEHDISNDFSSNSVLFRAPKKLKKSAENKKNGSISQYISKVQTDKENLSLGVSNCNDANPLQEVIQLEDSDDESPLPKIAKKDEFVSTRRCSRKKNLSSKIVQQASVQSIFSRSAKSATASRSNTDSSYFTEVTGEDHQFLIDLEKSVCSENEKLCPSCKHIIEVSQFQSHIKTCLKKFSRSKVGTRSNLAQVATNKEAAKDEPIKEDSSQASCSQSSKRIATLVGGQFVVKSNEEHDILDPAFYLEEKVLTSCVMQVKRAVSLQPTLGTKGALIYPKAAPSGVKRKAKSSTVNTLLMSVSERERKSRLKGKLGEIAAKTSKREWLSEERIRRPESSSDFESHERPLWQISSSDKGDIEQYYVSALAPHVTVPSLDAQMNITLHRHLSQIPGRMNITKAYDSDDEDHYESNVSVGPFIHPSGNTTQQVLAQLLASQSFFNMTYEAACKKEDGSFPSSPSLLPNSVKSSAVSSSKSTEQIKDTIISKETQELSKKEDCIAGSELNNATSSPRKIKDSINDESVDKNFTNRISTMSPNDVYNDQERVKGEKSAEVTGKNVSEEKIKVEFNSNSSANTELFNNEEFPSPGKSSKTILFEAVNDTASEETVLYPQHKVTESKPVEDLFKNSINNSQAALLVSEGDTKGNVCDAVIACDSNGSASELPNVETGVMHPVPDTDSSNASSTDPFEGTPGVEPFQLAPLSCLSKKNLTRFNSLQDTIHTKTGSQSSGFLMDRFLSQLHSDKADDAATKGVELDSNREIHESLTLNFLNDWAKMLDRKETCDVIVTTESASIAAHSFVLMVRCVGMYEEIQASESVNSKTIPLNCPYDAAYSFLRYIYTGQFDSMKIRAANLNEVKDLAIKYKCHDLLSCINSHQLKNPLSEKCDTIKVDDVDANEEIDNKTTSSFLLEAFETKSKIEIKSNDPGKRIETNLKANISNDVTALFGENENIPKSVKNTRLEDDLYNVNEKTINVGEQPNCSESINKKTVISDVEDNDTNSNYHGAYSIPLADFNPATPEEIFVENLSAQRSHSPDLFGNDFPDRDDGESDETDIFKEVKKSEVVDLSQSDAIDESLEQPLKSPSRTSLTSVQLSNTEIEIAENMSVCSKVNESEVHISNVWDDFENLGGDYMAMDELPDIEPTDIVVKTYDKADVDAKVVESNVRLNSTVMPASDSKSLNMSASCPNVSRISSGIAKQIISSPVNVRDEEIQFCHNESTTKDAIGGIRNVINDDSLARLQDEMANDWEDEDFFVMESNAHSGIKSGNSATSNNIEKSSKDTNTSFKDRITALRKSNGASPLPLKRVQQLKDADTNKTPLNKRCPTMDSSTARASDSSFAVTPNPDYNAMDTPEIKNALEKFGIRPMGRNKARKLLQHIYEQTHPVASDAETSYAEDSHADLRETEPAYGEDGALAAVRNTSTPLTKSQPQTSGGRKVTASSSPVKNVMIDLSQSDEDSNSYDGCAEESMTVPSDTQNSGDTSDALRQLITRDASLHKAILLYQPIWLNHFKELVRSSGLKCTIAQMVNFLDKQCITFKMGEPNAPKQPRTRKKAKKRK